MIVPASRQLAFSECPLVDVGALVSGDPAGIPAAAEAISRACRDVGFMYVTNTGVSPATVRRVTDEAAKFFALSEAEKMTVALENSPHFLGYLPLEYTGEEGESGKNLQEAFVVCDEDNLAQRDDGIANQWPQALPSLRPAMMEYFAAMDSLAARLRQGLALALGLAPDYFDPAFANSLNRLKLNHYPPQEIMSDTEMMGVGGHTDHGGYTLLWQDSLGGLEIKNKDGDWVSVPPIEGALVVNIADLMQLWSNGQFSSTEHRVINRYGKDRYSIAFFVDPSYDTMVSPVVGDVPADVTPVNAGSYLDENRRRVYPQRVS